MAGRIERITGVDIRRQGPAFLVSLGHCATHWTAAFFYLLLPFITRDLGLSYAQAGLLVTVFHASAFAANFGSGAVVDLSGKRVPLQVASLLAGAAALALFGATGEVLVLGALVAVIGASNNLWHPPAIAFLSQSFPDNRGYALSIHALGANLGDTVAPVAAGALIVAFTWPGAAVAGAIPVVAVAAIIAFMLMPGERAAHREGRAHKMGVADYLRGLAALARRRAVLGLCLMAGFRSMTQNGLYVFLPLYLVNVIEAGPLVTGFAVMAMQIGGVVAAPIAGVWSDRIGRRPVVLAGLTVTTVAVAGLTLASNEVVFIAGVAVLGFALFAIRPVVHSWLMDLSPPALHGSAAGLMFGTQSMFSMVVPPIGGLVADLHGLPAVFYLLAATILIANVLAAMLPAQAPRH